ncbi:putative xanthine dehydrogenase [Violaceomyces palustris]|uniref:Xanthine dehydrogenase n=1 Tax=Violaceomyces palustris TaxID=1673888 RepID=A0ACD0NPQ2_9BASI|nr:putative xanthine dehydrogenase [Violaceomyces palustris]
MSTATRANPYIEVEGFKVPSSFSPSSKLVFTLNRTRYQLSPARGDDIDLTLLEFVRSKGFTGTKLGCGEGGCGACTVVVGKHDNRPSSSSSSSNKAPYRYKSVNACLLPLIAVHGCHVLTVEGIGSSEDPHPIQERIGKLFGSQCGFCTPGIVMSLYATVRNGYGHLTEEEIEHSLDGCLCRCTGYRPILDAAKTFATVKSSTSSDASSTDSSSQSELQTPSDEGQDPLIDLATRISCPKGADCCQVKGTSDGKAGCASSSTNAAAPHSTGVDLSTLKAYEPGTEIIFPPYLSKPSYDKQDLIFVEEKPEVGEDLEAEEVEGGNVATGGTGREPAARQVWIRPGSLETLVECMKLYNGAGAKIRSGNTETGIEVKFKHMRYNVSIFVSDHLEELAFYRSTPEGITIGANLALTDVATNLKKDSNKDEYPVQVRKAILENLGYFASNQIRNVATLAGNIATASPISDLNPVWVALGAELYFIDPSSDSRQEQSVNMRNFFLGYRKTALPQGAILTRLFVPTVQEPAEKERSFVQAFKQAKRKDDDIAIVNGCLRMTVAADGVITDAHLAYGGMGPTTMQSKQTEAFLVGQRLSDPGTLNMALELLSTSDFPLSFGVPGGMPVFRKSLALGFLARFWGRITKQLSLEFSSETVPSLEELAEAHLERGVTKGSQDFEDVAVKQPSGSSVPHLSAMKQVTGEAIYIDDMPPVADELYGALVQSTRAHAKLIKVDPSEALKMEGVVDYISAKDIPEGGSNIWCPPAMDDVFFAEGEVHTVGQVIGVIVAENKRLAQAAARAVKIEYEDLPHILSIDEAIEAQSFFKARPVIHHGVSPDHGWDEYEHVLEGETRMGGQEHFYLETNACLIVPGKEDNEIEVFSSTQNPSETQVFCASILGIPNNRVITRVKRLGGGFGGKESRTISLAAPMTLAAYKLKRPVRCMLDRDEDMLLSGQRHPFQSRWKIAFSSSGKLLRLDAKVYNNGGWSQDLSQAVLERAMFHIDNCYNIPDLRVAGFICKTNTMSNTAFRGFGGPQGMFICEDFMVKVADKLGMQVETLREMNMYKEGEETHFNQKLIDWNVPTLWQQIKTSAEYEKRRAEVDAFNASHRWKKRGLSMIPTKFGISFTAIFLNQASALIHVYHHDGSVLFSHGGTEMGQGLHTKMAQLVATELNIPLGMVHLMETSTLTAANTSPTAASASSDLNGMALKHACDQLNQRLAPFRKEGGKEAWAKAVHDAYFNRVSLSAVGHYKTPDIGYSWETGRGDPFFYFTQGTAVSEVEVDTLTGDHRIVRADIHMDIGRSINPSIDVGQIEGAFTQGYGLTTMEETLFLNNGQLATRGPGNYKIPAFLDTPEDMRISFLKGPERKMEGLRTIQTSKGVGEPPLFLGSSVFFALRDAIKSARRQNRLEEEEVFVLDSPATAERIRTACEDPIVRLASKGTERKPGEKGFFVSIF